MMRVEDVRLAFKSVFVKSADIPNGFFLSRDGALWFKAPRTIVLIDARGSRLCVSEIPVDGAGTWENPQSVHGVIRIERNA